VLLVVIVALSAGDLRAQTVSAPEDEARTLPVGVFRFTVADSNARYSELFGPGGHNTAVLGGLNTDSLGVRQLPSLAPAQTAIQSLTGNSGFQLSLGQVIAEASVHKQTIPIAVEAGITRWLTVRASVPIVSTRTDVFANVNPSRFGGNVALNPSLVLPAALAADRAVYSQFIRANSTLTQALTGCVRNPGGANCGTILADSAALRALISQGSAFAAGLAQVYGGGSGPGATVVPVNGTTAQNEVNSKDATLTAEYNTFFHALGLPALTTLTPYAAPSAAALGDLETLITNPALGYAYDTLQTVTHTGIGDAQLSATVRLFDSFASDTLRWAPHGWNVRTAVTGVIQIGTGKPASQFSLTDPGTGTGANAIGVHSATDVMLGRHLWGSIIVRGNYPLADHQVERIPSVTGEALIPEINATTVGRQLGSSIELELAPRYVINDYFSVSTTYLIHHQAADHYTGTLTLDSAMTGYGTVQLDASTLGANTGYTAQNWGFGVTMSTLNAASRGKVSIPLDISYLHTETFASTGGYLPHQKSDAVVIRVYVRLFGTVTQGQRRDW